MKINGIEPTDLNNPIVRKISDLKFQNGTSVLMGNYKDAIKAQKELAKIGVDNFELVTKVPSRISGQIPLFSKYGLRVIAFSIFNKLRLKTIEEMKFGELCKLYKKGLIKF